DWGKAVAHSGFGIVTFGIAALLAWEVEDIRVVRAGETFEVGRYALTFAGVQQGSGPNFVSTIAKVDVVRNGRRIVTLTPEKRFYPVARMPTTEAAIHEGMFRDLYVVLGDEQGDGGWAVRTYVKPFANWIWAGCIIMALGGALSLSDRRHRVGVSARKTGHAISIPAE
ncbi:MAG: cytochrome c-type biogenesis CcmF C-terminal domain-containing protein, partial [Pseudomonadota bacterium]